MECLYNDLIHVWMFVFVLFVQCGIILTSHCHESLQSTWLNSFCFSICTQFYCSNFVNICIQFLLFIFICTHVCVFWPCILLFTCQSCFFVKKTKSHCLPWLLLCYLLKSHFYFYFFYSIKKKHQLLYFKPVKLCQFIILTE